MKQGSRCPPGSEPWAPWIRQELAGDPLDRLVHAAEGSLAPFVAEDGTVAFRMAALVVGARKS